METEYAEGGALALEVVGLVSDSLSVISCVILKSPLHLWELPFPSLKLSP